MMLLFTENNGFGPGLGKRYVGFFVFVFVCFCFCFSGGVLEDGDIKGFKSLELREGSLV